jgi:nitrile hydratase accessory protein
LNPPDPRAFAEPWHAQAFAIAVALNERGLFSWGEWSETLGAEIARAPERDYYENWLAALERLLASKGVAQEGELAALTQDWLEAAEATPHGEPIVLTGRRPAP